MIVALDVAFANLGWAVMDKGQPVEWGTIVTVKDQRKSVKVSDDFAVRCRKQASDLKEIFKKYPEIKGIVGELPGGSQSAAAARGLGAATGVVEAVATCFDLPLEWISEGDSKLAALNKRSAEKEEAMAWARAKYPDHDFGTVKKWFEHVADALMAYNGLRDGLLVRAFG